MLAAIRARFPNTPAERVWDDNLFNNWLNPNIPFSLAHYWAKASFGQADLRYQLFPPIVLDDPRAAMKPEEKAIWGKDREYLVNGVTAKISSDFSPDWGMFDALLIWFAQPTDMFGGGSYPVSLGYVAGGGGLLDFLFGEPDAPKKYLPVAVFDIASPFDGVCQELGHAFGFQHPLDRSGNEYGDPYDAMAAQPYGGKVSNFVRAHSPSLPVGFFIDGVDQQTVVGPLVSGSHLYNSPFASGLKVGGPFVEVPPSYLTGASSFTLHALDFAADRWPAQKLPAVAVLPPATPDGRTYFLELRRKAGYDSGIRGESETDESRPPTGIAIHYFDKVRQRVVYLDSFPLVNDRGDRDYHSFGGFFTFRVTSIGKDFASVGITVGGADFWRNFGLDIEQVTDEVVNTHVTEWETTNVSPCFLFPVGEYSFRSRFSKHRFMLVATSFGYEKPGYIWSVDGAPIDPAQSSISVAVSVQQPKPEGGYQIESKFVELEYTISHNILTLTCEPRTRPAWSFGFESTGNLSLVIELRVAETSPEVIKNLYQDRTIVTSVRFRNVEIEWDERYGKAIAQCEAAIDAVNRKRIPAPKLPGPEPDPFELPQLADVINVLVEKNPALASSVINEVAELAKIPKLDVLRRLEGLGRRRL